MEFGLIQESGGLRVYGNGILSSFGETRHCLGPDVQRVPFDVNEIEAREDAILMRERELSELPTPVLKLREGLLLIPVVGTLDSYRARSLTVRLLEGIRENRARSVVLDITGVSAVDSAVANHLIQTMSAARLMGASSVLTGLSAEVAQSLVKVGVTGENLNTAGDLQQGIELAEAMLAA